MTGDTIIGINHYQKLLQSGILYTIWTGPNGTTTGWSYYNNTYKGAIRQYTSSKKVFIVPPDSATEELLYDFNLSLGDTLPITFNNSWYTSNYVSKIDSILVGNNYRKRYIISNPQSIDRCVLIEGIGGSFGLLYQIYYDGAGLYYSSALFCFHDDSIAYLNTDTISNFYPITTDATYNCDSNVGIQKLTVDNSNITLYPNPNNGTFTLSYHLQNSQLSTLNY